MPELRDFFDTLEGIKEQDRTYRIEMDATLLHVRARQIVLQKREHLVFCALVNIGFGIVGQILTFIAYPFTNTLRFFLSILAALIAYTLIYPFLSSELLLIACSYFLAYIIVNTKNTQNVIREFCFDIADILTFGFLTKKVSQFIINSGRAGCRLIIDYEDKWYKPKNWALSYYQSRQPYKTIKELAVIEDKIIDLPLNKASVSEIQNVCDSYWDTATVN